MEYNGMIVKGVGGLYDVRLASFLPDGTRVIACRARGLLRHQGVAPVPGDRVLVAPAEACDEDTTSGGAYTITEILPRANVLIRPPMANLNKLFVILSAARPAPIPETADKLLAIAEYHGIEPIVVITKADLDPGNAQRIAAIYTLAGYPTFVTSTQTGRGIDMLTEAIHQHFSADASPIAAFAGASGAGKSTLLNALFPSLTLETAEVSRKTARGRHTTRSVVLYPVGELLGKPTAGGYLADTPGFSMLDFARFDFLPLDVLPNTFREFRPLIGQCRYKKCTHTKEEGCAILEAVNAGRISPSRHESYLHLYETLKAKPAWKTAAR